MSTDIRQHIIDFAKGILAAIAVAAGTAAIQYIGAHIPEWLQFVSQAGAATAVIKNTHP